MAYKKDIIVDAGSTFSTEISLEDDNGDPILLNNFTANSIFKKWYTSSYYTVFNTTVNGNTGTITLQLDATTTANLDPGRYVYDINLFQVGTNNIIRIVEGIVTVTPAVTDGVYLSNNTDSY